MLVRTAMCALGVVDVGVFAWQALTEWQQHPHFLQESLNHRVSVVGASAMLVAQIVAVGLAVRGRSSRSSAVRNAAAAVVLFGAALFNAASLFVLGIHVWLLVKPGFEAMPGFLALIAVWVPANLAAFIAAWRCRPWAVSPHAKAAFRRMLIAAALSLLLVVCLVVGWLKLFGVHIETTPAAFTQQSGSPLFVVSPAGMYVQFEVTPSKEPSEAGWIYDAVEYRIPVAVTVPFRGHKLSFRISAFSPEGDFIVPCSSKPECAEILLANGFELPPELSAAP